MTDWRVINANVCDVLEYVEPESIDAVLSDPPYGLGFMGKGWDREVPGPELWAPVVEAMRPGASIFAYSGTRTQHHLAVALEEVSLELRDVLIWLYASGFPKNHNISKAIDRRAEALEFFCYPGNPAERFAGHGTALNPSYEPIIWAMKARDGSFAENAIRHGVAGLDIDAGRIDRETIVCSYSTTLKGPGFLSSPGGVYTEWTNDSGNWPKNVQIDDHVQRQLGERGRYFYCAKASREEREAGLDEFREVHGSEVTGRDKGAAGAKVSGYSGMTESPRRNVHPTVKPIDLCRHYAAMLLPPKRDTPRTLLVPFSGSGSEMIGALLAGWDRVIGIEIDHDYCRIARARLEHWQRFRIANSERVEAEKAGQETLF